MQNLTRSGDVDEQDHVLWSLRRGFRQAIVGDCGAKIVYKGLFAKWNLALRARRSKSELLYWPLRFH